MKKIFTVGAAIMLAGTLAACGGPAASSSTPAVCVDALNEADELIGLSADVTDIMADAMQGPVIDALVAADSGDYLALDRAAEEIEGYTVQIDNINAKISRSDYKELKGECQK